MNPEAKVVNCESGNVSLESGKPHHKINLCNPKREPRKQMLYIGLSGK
jgi:hypothetical protein